MTREPNSAGPAGDKGTSGQNVPKSPKGLKNKKSKFRMESEQEKISKSKLRMERREDKLNRARKKLEGKKPPKPRGPVRRALGAAGWNVHGFVHGKVYEAEHENLGTEGAHRSELMGEAVLRQGTRYAKKRMRWTKGERGSNPKPPKTKRVRKSVQLNATPTRSQSRKLCKPPK